MKLKIIKGKISGKISGKHTFVLFKEDVIFIDIYINNIIQEHYYQVTRNLTNTINESNHGILTQFNRPVIFYFPSGNSKIITFNDNLNLENDSVNELCQKLKKRIDMVGIDESTTYEVEIKKKSTKEF